jgi:hypothetical protein
MKWIVVATIALGSQPRQGLAGCKLGVTFHVLGSAKECEGMNLHTPKWIPILGVREPQWTPEFSEGYCRGQNPLDWDILYIIEKLLKRRCLKWARMTHLDIWNTSYGQMKGRKSNW